jgi:hypothetical protein
MGQDQLDGGIHPLDGMILKCQNLSWSFASNHFGDEKYNKSILMQNKSETVKARRLAYYCRRGWCPEPIHDGEHRFLRDSIKYFKGMCERSSQNLFGGNPPKDFNRTTTTYFQGQTPINE